MADVQILHLAAAIDKHRLRILAQEVARIFRFQMFHRRWIRSSARGFGRVPAPVAPRPNVKLTTSIFE
jgi:hypothetical protein